MWPQRKVYCYGIFSPFLNMTPNILLASGKSSIILLLLRLPDDLLPSYSENITIGGSPLYKIDRAALRQLIIAVPQEPVFLPDGTSFMSNLDPFNNSTKPECRPFWKLSFCGTLSPNAGASQRVCPVKPYHRVTRSYSISRVLFSVVGSVPGISRGALVQR